MTTRDSDEATPTRSDQIRASVLAIRGAAGAILLILLLHGFDLGSAAVSASVFAAVLAVTLMVRRQRKTGQRP